MIPTKLSLALIALVIGAACGGSATAIPSPTSTPEQTAILEAPAWRYVNSGWLTPHDVEQTAAITKELRAFVITSQKGLDDFEGSVELKRSRGTAISLERADFTNSIVLAAYYLWRPLQGDPLSVDGFTLNGDRADVFLVLEESPQGKEYPFLFAPMTMVAVDRSQFQVGEPVDFVFHLDGEPLATVVATVD